MAGIPEEDVECALKKVHNCKSSVIYKFPNFWHYYPKKTNNNLAKEMVNGSTKISPKVTKGITLPSIQELCRKYPPNLQTNYIYSHYLQTVEVYSDKTDLFLLRKKWHTPS